jgi:hypothetical protein
MGGPILISICTHADSIELGTLGIVGILVVVGVICVLLMFGLLFTMSMVVGGDVRGQLLVTVLTL